MCKALKMLVQSKAIRLSVHITQEVAVFSTVQNQVVPTTRNAFKDSSDSLSLDPFYQGFVAGVLKDSTVFTFDNAEKYFTDFYKANEERKVAAVKAENEKWLKDNATKEGVKTTASGFAI